MLLSYHRVYDDVMLPGVLGLWLAHAIRTGASHGVKTARRWVYGAGAGMVLVLLGAGWVDLPVQAAETIGVWLHSLNARD